MDTASKAEEIIDVLFSGRTHMRALNYREQQTVMAFKDLFAEVLGERCIELKFDIIEKRKEVARLEESIGILGFVDAWQDEVQYPRHL